MALVLLVATAVFWASGGHVVFVGSMARSFVLLPPGAVVARWSLSGEVSAGLVQHTLSLVLWGGELWALGALLALPWLAAMGLTQVTLGFVARAAPQIHAALLGMSLQALLGVRVLLIVLRALTDRVLDALLRAMSVAETWLQTGFSP